MLILSAQIQPSVFVHRQILCAAVVDDVVVDNIAVDAVDAWNGRSCRLWH